VKKPPQEPLSKASSDPPPSPKRRPTLIAYCVVAVHAVEAAQGPPQKARRSCLLLEPVMAPKRHAEVRQEK
jgi:hypothetical protein